MYIFRYNQSDSGIQTKILVFFLEPVSASEVQDCFSFGTLWMGSWLVSRATEAFYTTKKLFWQRDRMDLHECLRSCNQLRILSSSLTWSGRAKEKAGVWSRSGGPTESWWHQQVCADGHLARDEENIKSITEKVQREVGCHLVCWAILLCCETAQGYQRVSRNFVVMYYACFSSQFWCDLVF